MLQLRPAVDVGLPPLFDLQPRRHSVDGLVQELRECLCSTPAPRHARDVPVDRLKNIMNAFTPHDREWLRFGSPNPTIPYTRLMIDSVPGRYNLLFIVWNPRKRSPIHDHADSHCIMKIVHGAIKETIYHQPSTSQEPMSVQSSNVHSAGDLAYISDDVGLHDVGNDHPTNVAVSVHLYTPPNAADHGFHTFDAATGQKRWIASKPS